MVQWLGLLIAIVAYNDEKSHREWQRKQTEDK